MADDIRGYVRQFILSECLPGESEANLADDSMIRQEGILDSMKLLQLVSALEEKYGVTIEAYDVSETNFGSVERIVAFTQSRVG